MADLKISDLTAATGIGLSDLIEIESGGNSYRGTVQQLFNIIQKKRVTRISSSGTPSINTDTTDVFTITALASNITSMSTNLTGTPNDRQELVVYITATGGTRTISWGASYSDPFTVGLTTSLASGKTAYLKFQYDALALVWVLLDQLVQP